MQKDEKEISESRKTTQEKDPTAPQPQDPAILEEITIEELAVDGICGIY